ncbi:MAG: hypothetical protein GY869_00800, partial [Planctomycetes bacterium]|nr:hypothetical protein [Planctomycetota bacterium]
AGGDYSGPQDQLSAFELAAQAAGNASYWGQRCRVNTVTYKCDCPSEPATSRFDFPTTNDLSWVATVVSGTINMSLGRAGINTWIATLGGQATTQIELIFLENGYQYTTITTFGDGTTVSCPSVWAR